MIAQTSMSPYMSPVSTYQVWMLLCSGVCDKKVKTNKEKKHSHSAVFHVVNYRVIIFIYRIDLCITFVVLIHKHVLWGFGRKLNVTKAIWAFQAGCCANYWEHVISGNSSCSVHVCLQSVFVCVMFQVQNPSWVPHQQYIMQHPVRA